MLKNLMGKDEKQVDLELFTIYDSKSQSYDQPTFAPNRHVLMRDVMNLFRDSSQQKQNKYYLNAEDFSIHKIGSYDKKTGLIESQNLEHIANMHDLRALIQAETGPGIVST